MTGLELTPEAVRRLAVQRGLVVEGEALEPAVIVQVVGGRIVFANDAAVQALGLPRAHILSRDSDDPRWATVDPEGRPVPARAQPAMRVLAHGRPVRDVVLGVHRPDVEAYGEHVWIRVSSEPLRVPGQDEPYAALTAFRPVPEEEAEQLRRRAADRGFRLIAEHSREMVAMVAVDGTRTWVSPSYSRVTGHDRDALIGRSVLEHLHPDDAAELARVLAGELPEAALQDLRVRFRHADGRWMWLETAVQVVRDSRGIPRQGHIASRDVTERVRLEQARDAALAETSLLIEHAPIGMGVADRHGRWVRVNRAFCELFGRTADELVGRTFASMTHPDDRASTAVEFARMLDGEIERASSEKRYLHADGHVLWVLRTASLVPGRDADEPTFIAQLLDISERKKAQETLSTLALTDTLTGLPNRMVLTDRLQHAVAAARRNGGQVGVVFCDLDLFKHVNDSLGHAAGDELLQQAAERLRAVVREQDTAVRLGGDEFVVVCDDVHDLAQLRALAVRVSTALEQPYDLARGRTWVTVSIGLSLGSGPSADSLLAQADAAMYRVKESGRSGIDVFDDAAQAEAVDRLALVDELDAALHGGQLRLHYQPIVDLADGRTLSHEALLRWEHPEHGLLLPDRFLPAAEQSQLIIRVGEWVLRQACADAVRAFRGVGVAVNVSPRQLATARFAETVASALATSGLPATALTLEITESSVLNASPSTLHSVQALTELGVRLGLDDFGTGQSSVTALHRLPVRTFKIDRSFVRDLPGDAHAAALVHGLVQLGAGMGLSVVAEGVETAEQAAWLAGHGCPAGQGYLFGMPGPLAS